jgi:hypothetical protein
MLWRRNAGVGHCLNRAAEAGHLAALANEQSTKASYLRLAQSWLTLAQSTEFTEKLDAFLAGEKLE